MVSEADSSARLRQRHIVLILVLVEDGLGGLSPLL